MILLIEEDLVTCHIMTALMKRLRHAHVVAHSGAEALEQVGRQPVDLIITDVQLPDVDGLELVEQFMVKPYLQDIPVLICTGTADAKTVERALALGVVDFVRKPINVDAFAIRIERALKRAPARWESWRDMIKRLRVDSRTFHPLLMLARDHLAEVLQMLGRIRDGRTTIDEVGADELSAGVRRVHSAALNVGAVRTVQLVDFLWSGRATPEDVADLHAALTIELAAFDQALQSRASSFFSATGQAR